MIDVSDPVKTLLIVPPNDEEAYLIAELGEKKGFQIYRSVQAHGARLERETGLMDRIIASQALRVIIVELPGPEVEEKIRTTGRDVVIIDHHNYADIERAYGAHGELLPSSLEQFLRIASIADADLMLWGYDPLLVRGIGLWDAGYLWQVLEAGYSHEEVERVIAFKDHLSEAVGAPDTFPLNRTEARRAFAEREPFGEAFVVVSGHPTAQIRSSVSRLFATTYWKPTTVIMSERNGKRLYVQETDRAVDLFHHFGGFTFGTDRNWGYDNETEGEPVTLAQVKAFLS